MPASGRRGGKSKYSASPSNSGNSFKSPPKKKFHSILSINGVNATSSSDNATSGDIRRKAGDNVRTTRTTGRVSNTVQTGNIFNVGNKTLEDVTTQDDESVDSSSDDDNVNHTVTNRHTLTHAQKRRLQRSL